MCVVVVEPFMQKRIEKGFWGEDLAADGGAILNADGVGLGSVVSVEFEHGAAVATPMVLTGVGNGEVTDVNSGRIAENVEQCFRHFLPYRGVR